MKTLESSIADRINALSPTVPNNLEAFVNHLTILDRAEDLNDSDGTLHAAVQRTAIEFNMRGNEVVARVLAKLAPNGARKAA